MKKVATSRFRVVSRLGGDDMTESHLCYLQGVEGFEKEVVVKRLRPERARQRHLVQTFLDQARQIARLSHGNIIQIFEVDEDQEGAYVATEYVKGVTLQMIGERAWKAGKVHYGHMAKLLAGACDALAYLHGAVDERGQWTGVVHRDVSLAGVVVSLDGIPKLHDLAVAGAEPQHSSDPVANAQYARRVDAFGVGATLFKMTTNTSVWGGAHRHPVGSHHGPPGPVLRPSEVVAGYPPDLELIVLGAIEAHSAASFPSVQALSDLLEDFAAGPAHRSTTGTLSAWLRELFPDPAALGKTAAALLPVAPAVLVTPQAEKVAVHSPTPGPGPSPIGGGIWKVAVPLAVLLLGIGIYAGVRNSSPPSAPVAAPSPLSSPAAATPPAPPPPAPAPALPPPAPAAVAPRPAPPPEPAARPQVEPEPRRAPQVATSAAVPPTAHRIERPERVRTSASPRRVALVPGGGPPAPRASETPERPVAERAPEPAPAPSPPPEPVRKPAPSVPEPAPRPVASATTAPRSEPLAPAQPGLRPASSGPAISAPPKSPVPIPALPRMMLDPQPDQVARACQAVESAAISQAGVSPEFARGVTGPFRRSLKAQAAIYPIAMYYFVVREAALKHNSAAAAAALATAQANGTLVRFKDLPGIDRGL